MSKQSKFHPYIKRLVIVALISLFFVVVFNEIMYLIQKDQHDRSPESIELVIPAGTGKRVEAGEDDPGIPDEMVFVLGDTLVVKNEDSVSHQLGPVWVPPGTSASLVMERAQNYLYSCSFQTSRYLGLDVREPTTWGTRLAGIGLAAPTLAALVFLYSLLIFPVDKPKKTKVKAVPVDGQSE